MARVARTFAFLAAALCARAEVTLPFLIADHMVIQRGLPVHVWGKAEPGEKVAVTFRGETRSAVTDPLGRWSVYLRPGDAGGPFTLTVNRKVLDDVLVGDVWVASGQSNMEWPIAWAGDAKAVAAAAQHPRIRLVHAMHRVSEYPLDDLYGEMWRECTPQSAGNFSAVAYHFGAILQQKLNVPIGLVQTAWGGTPVDAWTSLGAIARDPGLMPVFAEWDRLMQEYALDRLRYHRAAKDWEKQVPRLPPPPEKPVGPGGPWTPGGLFNAMVAPVTPMPIKGVIWYQGEANGSETRAPLYGRLFRAMIEDWRRAWGIGDFPFLFVQLANFKTTDSDWPAVREGQRQALELRNTGMAVTIDIGTPESIHPPDKKTVGARLALAARALAYGEPVEYSGPALRQVTAEDGALRVWFDHAAGLSARGGEVRGFELAGADRKYAPAQARIEGATVLVRSESVPAPLYVRYGWRDSPDCNLFNAAGLPASPFKRD